MFEVSAVMEKSDIPLVGKMIGASNADTFSIGDVTFEPGEAIFKGFEGRRDSATGKYVGVYNFVHSVGAEPTTATMKFNELPSKKAVAPKRVAAPKAVKESNDGV